MNTYVFPSTCEEGRGGTHFILFYSEPDLKNKLVSKCQNGVTLLVDSDTTLNLFDSTFIS